VVGPQGLAEQPSGAERRRAAFEIFQDRRPDAAAVPAVVDRQAELEARRLIVKGITRLPDDGLTAVDFHGGDNAELIGLADMDVAFEQAGRQLADRTEKAVVAGSRRESAEIVLQRLRIAWLDEAHRDGLAVLR